MSQNCPYITVGQFVILQCALKCNKANIQRGTYIANEKSQQWDDCMHMVENGILELHVIEAIDKTFFKVTHKGRKLYKDLADTPIILAG